MLIDMGPLLAEELGQSAVVKLLIFHSNSSFSIVNLRLAFTLKKKGMYIRLCQNVLKNDLAMGPMVLGCIMTL